MTHFYILSLTIHGNKILTHDFSSEAAPYLHGKLIVFIYIYTFSSINKKSVAILLIIFFGLTNTYLTSSFLSFIEINNGAHRSDYGKVYNICGCCVDDVKECKGQ